MHRRARGVFALTHGSRLHRQPQDLAAYCCSPRSKDVTHVPLARLHRFPGPAAGGALHPGPFADRPEPALQAGGRDDERRRLRRRLVRRRADHRDSSAASSRRGTTSNLRELAGHLRSAHCSSRTSARRSGRPFSRATAIRFATAAGCGCTTDSSTASRLSSATWCSPSTNRCSPRSGGSRTPRSSSSWRSPSALRTIRQPRSRVLSGSSRHAGARTDRAPVPGHDRDHRRPEPVGVPLLERRVNRASLFVLPRRPHAQSALSRAGDLAGGVRRRAAARVGAYRRPARRLAGSP